MAQNEDFSMGVEEEYQIIDPKTRQLCGRSQLISKAQSFLGDEVVKPEFRQSQIEIATPICSSLQDVRSHLSDLRNNVMAAAAQTGKLVAAAGTHPFSHWQEQPPTPQPRYQQLMHHYQHIMGELVIFGCHVHIGVPDREMAIQVMNRARSWLPPLLALSASSPFWLGSDTGYASYRAMLANRLPMAGAPQIFESYRDYRSMVQLFIDMQTIQDPTQVCWDIRPSEKFPTLEFRIMDVCMTVDEAVMLTGLIRGLVKTCYDRARANIPYVAVRPELLRAARWHAARWGIGADLIDVDAQRLVPAQALIEDLLTFVRPALEDLGGWDEVQTLTQNTLRWGTGAFRQRSVYHRTGSLEEVVDLTVAEMVKGTKVAPF